MSDLGLYRPGSSIVHRAPAGLKVALLFAGGIGVLFLRTPLAIAVALVIILALYGLAGFTPLTAVRQARPLLWFLVAIAIFQVIAHDWQDAVVAAGIVVVLVMLAALVTLTTRTTEMIDVIVMACRPFTVFGVRPERVGLMIAMGIRAVPVLSGFANEILQAQKARGLKASPKAFAAPLIVRTLRHADAVGDALVARGLDD